MHKIVFHFLVIDDVGFYLFRETVFAILHALNNCIYNLIGKKEQSFDNVGMSFLLSTSVK
jgi:hypothetical protein